MARLVDIFQRQEEYMRSLAHIYTRNGFGNHNLFPYDLNDRQGQEELRLLAWRITEELIEALGTRDDADFLEEIADSFHFLIELAIVSGVPFAHLGEFYEQNMAWETGCRSSETWFDVVYELGQAMQLLKQRPWRTDDRRTPMSEWTHALRRLFKAFMGACICSEISGSQLYDAYFAKSKINDQRTAAQPL